MATVGAENSRGLACFKFADAFKDAAADAFSGDSAKKCYEHVSDEPDVGVKCRWKCVCRLSERFTVGVLWVA